MSAPKWGMAASVYQQVTDRIIAYIEQNQALPWRKPWHSRVPANAISGREYSGINRVLLSMAPYSDHRWLTYRAAQSLGGNVKKGEKATPVVLWHFDEDEEDGTRRVFCRTYSLFNVQQCENIALEATQSREVEPNSSEALQGLKALLDGYPKPPQFHSHPSEAFYMPQEDVVCVPPIHQFPTAELYASVLLHEVVHSTGHESRLARPGVMDVQHGTPLYQQEELIAEMGAAMLCQHLGIDTTWQLSAAYLKGWLQTFKSDAKLLVHAASHASRACDHVLGQTILEQEAERSAGEPVTA